MLEKTDKPVALLQTSEAEPCWPARKIGPVLAANAISLVALSLLMFRLQAPFTFYQYDGSFILSTVKNQAEWMPGLAAFTMDFLKGIGGLAFPVNARIIPGFLIGLAGGAGPWLPALSATWFAVEFAVATLVIGRAIGISLSAAVMAAWLALLGALPYVVPTPFMERLWGNPHLLSPISFSMIALALFLAIGRGSRGRSIACGAGIFIAVGYLAMAFPPALPIYAPILIFFGVVGLAAARSRAEIYWKLGTVAVVGVLYLACFGVWLSGFMFYSKLTYFLPEMYPSSIDWTWPSLLLEKPALRPGGVCLYFIALLGGAVAAFGRVTPLRPFARGYLLFTALLWLVTAAMILAGLQWHGGPPGGYLDMMIYPLHALFAANLLYVCLAQIADRFLRRPRLTFIVGTMAIVLLPWSVLAFWTPLHGQWRSYAAYPWPPQRTPIAGFLEHHIALHPGQPFRGRVVNLAGSRYAETQLPNAPMINEHLYDLRTAYDLGSDQREYGFWYYDIPTLEESSPSTSPFFSVLMSRLLNPKGAWFFRAHEWASVFDAPVLSELGVRYALTDQPLPDRAPVLATNVDATNKQYLYELAKPNVSGRAATKVTTVRTAAEALERLRASGHDIADEAVLFNRLPEGPLEPVSNSRLTVGRGFVSISADAPGRALLVLPLEYSRCLTFDWRSTGGAPPLALRANFAQTAILFSGHLEGRIARAYGPFANPTCRLRDMQDAAQVDLGAVPR